MKPLSRFSLTTMLLVQDRDLRLPAGKKPLARHGLAAFGDDAALCASSLLLVYLRIAVYARAFTERIWSRNDIAAYDGLASSMIKCRLLDCAISRALLLGLACSRYFRVKVSGAIEYAAGLVSRHDDWIAPIVYYELWRYFIEVARRRVVVADDDAHAHCRRHFHNSTPQTDEPPAYGPFITPSSLPRRHSKRSITLSSDSLPWASPASLIGH